MTTGRARGQKGKTQKKRFDWSRLWRWSLALGLFAVMGGGAALGVNRLQDPHVLPLKVVRIDGEFRYQDRVKLEQVVGRAVTGNFFTVDVVAIRRAAESLPWVDKASVRRVWPEKLSITIQEQKPLARWGKDRLVNGRGEIFSPDPKEIPTGLPEFAGPDEDASKVVRRYPDFQARFSPLNRRIAALRIDGRGSWVVVLDGVLQLNLGSEAVDERLQRFVRVYPGLNTEQGRRPSLIDLRYTNGLAVEWQDIEQPVADMPRSGAERMGKQMSHGKGRV